MSKLLNGGSLKAWIMSKMVFGMSKHMRQLSGNCNIQVKTYVTRR